MKKQTTELGKLVSETREKLGISQRELARRSNMDCAEVSRIEAGKRLKPNILYLKGIAETLNLSMIESYEKFYFDALDHFEENRKVDFAVKGCIADLIDKLELSKIEKKEIPNDEILERLKEIIPMIRPNLEKFDKSKYPSFDSALFPKRK